MKRTISVLAIAAIMITTLTYVAIGQAPAPGQAPAAAGAGRGGPGGAGAAGAAGGARGPVVAGPPQPVPPEVAIPRPTAAEVAQMNDEIAKMIEANKSATKPLLTKYRPLTVVQVPRDNSAIRPVPRNAAKHDSYVELAKKGDIDLLLVGDSITDLWRNSTETYATYFGKYKVGNFAISGDTTQGVLWGLQNGEGVGFQPKAIMMMIGTNNSGANTGPEIAEGVGSIVYELRKDFPNAKILLLAIFPRNAPTSPARKVNADASAIYSKLADNKNVFYMDIGQKFLSPDGTISTEIMADGLHPTAKGYVIWGDAVKDKLADLMK
jgi:lysophospholipase L1-like esterase